MADVSYMKSASQLRWELQTEEQARASDETHRDLINALKRTRKESGGIALLEIVECMEGVFDIQELEQIQKMIINRHSVKIV